MSYAGPGFAPGYAAGVPARRVGSGKQRRTGVSICVPLKTRCVEVVSATQKSIYFPGPFTVHFWAPMSKWLISGDHIFLYVYIRGTRFSSKGREGKALNTPDRTQDSVRKIRRPGRSGRVHPNLPDFSKTVNKPFIRVRG